MNIRPLAAAGIAAVTIAAGAAAAVVLTGDSSSAPSPIFCSEFVPEIQQSTYYPKWLSQNPVEKTRWESYRDSICSGGAPSPPSMSTHFGRALVAAGKLSLQTTSSTSSTTTTSAAGTNQTAWAYYTNSPSAWDGTGNIFIATTGSSGCTRNASQTNFAGASGHICDSLATACSKAQAGDEIGWEAGIYSGSNVCSPISGMDGHSNPCDPYGWIGNVSNTTNCIRIVPDCSSVDCVKTGWTEIHASGVWLNGSRLSGTCALVISACDADTYNFKASAVSWEETSGEATGNRHLDHSYFSGVNSNSIVISDIDYGGLYQSNIGNLLADSATGNTDDCRWIDSISGAVINSAEPRSLHRVTTVAPNHVVIEGNYWHDIGRTAMGANADCHVGAFLWASGNDYVIRKNTYAQNFVYTYEIQVGNGESPAIPAARATIENNMFACDVSGNDAVGNMSTSPGQSSIQFSDSQQNVGFLLRGNSGSQCTLANQQDSSTFSNTRLNGNITDAFPSVAAGSALICGMAGVTATYNVIANGIGSCGSTNVTGTLSSIYTSTTIGAENFTLANGSTVAHNLWTATGGDNDLAVDILGTARVQASKDAGAHEQG